MASPRSLIEWRSKTLKSVLLAIWLASLLALVGIWLSAIQDPTPVRFASGVINTIASTLILWTAVFKNLKDETRGIVFSVVVYIVSIFVLIIGGLSGATRSFMVATPVIVLMLLGKRGGWVMWILNLAAMVIVGIVGAPLLSKTLVEINSLNREMWFIQTTYTAIPMIALFLMTLRFNDYMQSILDDLRSAQSGLVQANQSLEKRIHERTQELEKAKEAAEKANLAKSLFLASMSHELRTPLNAVLGYAQILQNCDDLASDQAQRGLQIIHESGEHLLTLINDLLDLAKIESGKLELYPQLIDLVVFLDGVAGIISQRGFQKNIAFTFAREIPSLSVEADEKCLRQILLNLLGNAIKFTEEGEVKFCVALLEKTEKEARLRFDITDTGIGLSPDQILRLFRPFEQMADDKNLRDSGTGLGLALSQRLVGLMGGKIQVESQLGEGSHFWFELNLPISSEEAVSLPIEPIAYRGEARKCLIVDDKLHNRMVLRDMLSMLGFDIREAGGGVEAIEMSQSDRPDLIFMDVKMPGMNGLEAIREIRKFDTTTPILAVSASALGDDKIACIEAGANEFIAKPIKRGDLIKAIETHLAIEWIYQQLDTPKEAQTTINKLDKNKIGGDVIRAIRSSVSQGNFRQLVKIGRNLCESDDGAIVNFGSQLVTLAQRFDDVGIEKLIS